MATSERPAVVIDANLLRRPERIAELQDRYRRNGEQIVVADAAWNELVTNDRWRSTLKASFQHLAKVSESVVASWAVTALHDHERAAGVPAREVVHAAMTGFLRQLLVDLAHGSSNTLNRLEAALSQHGLNDKNSLALRRRDATARGVELARSRIPRDRLNSAKNDPRAFVDLVAELFEPAEVGFALRRQGVDPRTADRLTTRASVTVMTSLFYTHLALGWVVDHGLERAKLMRVHNDYVDVEYGVIAWAAGADYVTNDARAKRRFDDVVALSERFWP